MPTRWLPARPELNPLRRQARELRTDHAAGSVAAAARVAAHHPRLKGQPLGEILERPLKLSDAQLVVAHEYGFATWALLKERVDRGQRIAQIVPHPRFEEALAALQAGDLARLGAVLAAEPELLHARTSLEPPYGYFSAATLLHHVAGNPSWDRPLPANIADAARLLLERGADVNAETLGPNGGTTIDLVLTSKQASDANVSGPLIDVLLEFGARLERRRPAGAARDGRPTDLLYQPLANHAPRAAEKLIALGAEPDVCAAAALGRMDLLRESFDKQGRLRRRPRKRGRLMSERDAVGLALLFAYVNGHPEAVNFLLEKDGNWNMTGVNNGTALHRAAWDGDLDMVERLVARGADLQNRDNPFQATPLSWAQHNKQHAVFDWLRSHCAIDVHDASGFGLREHVEARLRDDPAAVNARRDQWNTPDCTPLHLASWTHYTDVDGQHSHDEADRLELVRLLLNRGADPNLVAGNGLTPLDVAQSAQAPAIAALLEQRGAKRAADL